MLLRSCMILFVITSFPCALSVTLFGSRLEHEQKAQPKLEEAPKKAEEVPTLDLSKNGNPEKPKSEVNNKNVSDVAPKSAHNVSVAGDVANPQKPAKNVIKKDDNEIESGALIRGVWVFVGIGLLFVIYVGIKTYRNKSGRQTAVIRKYGVRTRRNDVEMEPLPLDEDEDETVFDLGNFNNRA